MKPWFKGQFLEVNTLSQLKPQYGIDLSGLEFIRIYAPVLPEETEELNSHAEVELVIAMYEDWAADVYCRPEHYWKARLWVEIARAHAALRLRAEAALAGRLRRRGIHFELE